MNRSWVLTPIALLLLAGASYGAYLYLQPEPLPPQVLYANGHIEGTPVNIRSQLAASVEESRLEEGDTVQKGDLLVRLDDRELTAGHRQAKARIEALQASSRVVQGELDTWLHHRKTALKDLERIKTLERKGLASEQKRDQTENSLEEARGQVQSREARLAEITARIEAMKQEKQRLEIRRDKARVTAPIDGTVLASNVETGEVVQPGSLLAVLVNMRDLEMKVYVPENRLGKIRLGAPARVKVDAYPEHNFEARVKNVDQRAQFTPRDIHLPEERVRMVFGVTLGLANPGGVLKPGMPADAWILWEKGSKWPENLVVPGQ